MKPREALAFAWPQCCKVSTVTVWPLAAVCEAHQQNSCSPIIYVYLHCNHTRPSVKRNRCWLTMLDIHGTQRWSANRDNWVMLSRRVFLHSYSKFYQLLYCNWCGLVCTSLFSPPHGPVLAVLLGYGLCKSWCNDSNSSLHFHLFGGSSARMPSVLCNSTVFSDCPGMLFFLWFVSGKVKQGGWKAFECDEWEPPVFPN